MKSIDQTRFGASGPHDLGFGEMALLHRNLLVRLGEKTLLWHSFFHGEDYPPRRTCRLLLQRRACGTDLTRDDCRDKKTSLITSCLLPVRSPPQKR